MGTHTTVSPCLGCCNTASMLLSLQLLLTSMSLSGSPERTVQSITSSPIPTPPHQNDLHCVSHVE
uniref:Macaca fascicularis brain cDNA, clone: QflA-23182 n=1 Tax=Macaca fascicularis TaxID=9541 RepID=I7GIW5_MACFA|nr:unnamed protein product [Macaca fascicularis]